jgi:(S)-mandelate dehydrogenase
MMPKPAVNLDDIRSRAKRRLPRMVFDYLEGGAGSERGLGRNRAAFERLLFHPSRLVDVGHRDSSVELFGKRYPVPMIIGPTGLNGVLHPSGDVALARAAARAGIPFCLSTASTTTIEELARRSAGENWFQLYVVQRALAASLVGRAKDSGYTTLILTVDVPVNGKRERDLRSGFKIPFRHSPRIVLDALLHPAWTLSQLRNGLPELANFATSDTTSAASQAALMNRQMDASFDWSALAELRSLWPRTLLVKGIMTAADAVRCAAEGVDGIIISNHGARQLEDVPATVDLIAPIVEACDLPVLVDSGIRNGADVAKALAMGARSVLLGRSTLYGLAAHGEQGVELVLRMLTSELDTTMALVGAPSVGSLHRGMLTH